jgi:Reverse transcriptase (RNA-dependent DNA polymerase)
MGQDFACAGITLHLAGPGMHVHIIERTIRYVKEGVRGFLSGLRYRCPRLIFIHMVPFVANRLNMFPSSTRTDNISAFQLIFNRHCQLEFGAYYQVNNRLMDNTVDTPRTYGAIGVGQSGDGNGTCTFVALHNGAIFKANTFKALPMPTEVIMHLTRMAAADKIKIPKDPIFQIDALMNPALDDAPSATEPALTPAEDSHQDLAMLDITHTDRAPSPPPNTHRADDLPPSSSPIRTEADSGGGTPMHADDRQAEQTPTPADFTDEPDAPEERDTPLSSDLSTAIAETNDDPGDIDGPEPTTPAPPPAMAAPQPHVYPTRTRRAPDRLNLLCVNHMTARKALKENPDEALPVIRKELETLLRKKAFHATDYNELDHAQRKGIIRSQINVTQKYAPSSDGKGRIKDKLKARLVGGGDCQDRNLCSRADTSSPTASTSAIMIIAQLAAAEGRHVISLDIGSAYLNAKMPKDDPSKLVFILTDIDPTYKKFLRPNGSIIVELDQALYGCIESAPLWYKELSTFLASIGFTPNPYEIKEATGGANHNRHIRGRPPHYKPQAGTRRGSGQRSQRQIQRTEGHHGHNTQLPRYGDGLLTINQVGMIEDIIRKARDSPSLRIPTASPTTPSIEQLFEASPDSPPISDAAQTTFHSLLAKFNFIAGRGRPDLLTGLSFLLKRVLAPTEEDERKLAKYIGYAASTSNLTLRLRCNLPPKVTTFIDASFATHTLRGMHHLRNWRLLQQVHSPEAQHDLLM